MESNDAAVLHFLQEIHIISVIWDGIGYPSHGHFIPYRFERNTALKHTTNRPQYRMPLWASLLTAVLLAGFYTIICLWCQPNSLRYTLGVLVRQPLLIVLNALPVGLLILSGAFLL